MGFEVVLWVFWKEMGELMQNVFTSDALSTDRDNILGGNTRHWWEFRSRLSACVC